MTTKRMQAPFLFAEQEILAGTRETIDLPLPRLYTHDAMSMTTEILHGRRAGKSLFLCAAIHGDELNGIEIIRRVLMKVDPKRLRGTVVAVPIVNVFGLINQSRYLPDRRDLNRSFPGSSQGSLAARVAHLFTKEVASRCGYGIDLHTAGAGRTNLPQIRANLDDPVTRELAQTFGAPVMIHASTRDGSLRESASKRGVSVLVYEAGEPNRFNDDAIDAGVSGVMRVMQSLSMLPGRSAKRKAQSFEVRSSSWARARQSGFLHLETKVGERVTKGQVLGVIRDAMGERGMSIRAPYDGVIIGHGCSPLVHRGDAVVHIAAGGVSNGD